MVPGNWHGNTQSPECRVSKDEGHTMEFPRAAGGNTEDTGSGELSAPGTIGGLGGQKGEQEEKDPSQNIRVACRRRLTWDTCCPALPGVCCHTHLQG